jgi:DUF971 family protein
MRPRTDARMPIFLILTLCLAGTGVYAQRNDNFLRWRGRVDGSDILRIQGRNVRIQHQSARPIQNERFEFASPLPSRDVRIRLDVRQGRGRVEILESPNRGNNYTASILVDDNHHSGSDDYEFYLYWDEGDRDHSPGGGGRDHSSGGGDRDHSSGGGWWDRPYGQGGYDFVWEGWVDGSDYLFIRGNSAWIRHLESRPIEDARYNFRSELPRRDQIVQLDVQQGRGRVSIEEQPNHRNNYTLKILLDDSRKNGSDFYRIGLRWQGGGGGGSWDHSSGARYGQIRWSGTVDGRDRLLFHGRTVDVRHLDARPIRNMRVDFSDALPRNDTRVRLEVIRGRGDVRILQQPDHRNGYTLEVEIYDPKGGDDEYEFVLTW